MRDRSLKVGADISIVTFDDVGPVGLLEPSITAVRQRVNDMGARQ